MNLETLGRPSRRTGCFSLVTTGMGAATDFL